MSRFLIAVAALAVTTAGAAQRGEPREHAEHRARVVHAERAAAYTHQRAAVSSHQNTHAVANAQVHVVHYGNAVSGTVERPVRPGFVSRTYVSGGHVLYTHVYQRHVWHQFGRSFTYEAYVPGYRFPAAYYGWALGTWPHPVAYSWGWRAQPWYPAYGALFTPYPVYASPDLWMTDYILAQSMQAAYQAQAIPAPPPAATNYVDPAAAPDATAAQSEQSAPTPPPGQAAPAPAAPTPTAPPPAVTPQIKAQLDAQIKVQLQEQQAATATPATLTTQSGPAALRPNHVFFAVVQPLDVPSGPSRH